MTYMEALIGALLTISVTFITLYFKEIYFPKQRTIYFNKHKSICYIELDRECLEIKRAVGAAATYVAYFHNGGTFINGISMDKYTVVGESYREYLSSYKKRYVNSMINNYAYAFHRLIVEGRYNLNVNDGVTNIEDRLLTSDLKSRVINNIYMFLIKDPIKNTPLGFIGIEYDNEHGMTVPEGNVWKHHNKIANLLNQTYTEK